MGSRWRCGAVMVVEVEPGGQGAGALAVGVPGSGVGPFGEQGAVEAFDFAVGLGPVGAGEGVSDGVEGGGETAER